MIKFDFTLRRFLFIRKIFKQTLILASEANSTLSGRNGLFFHILAHFIVLCAARGSSIYTMMFRTKSPMNFPFRMLPWCVCCVLCADTSRRKNPFYTILLVYYTECDYNQPVTLSCGMVQHKWNLNLVLTLTVKIKKKIRQNKNNVYSDYSADNTVSTEFDSANGAESRLCRRVSCRKWIFRWCSSMWSVLWM